MTRYVAEPRPNWCPPAFVVIDGDTGKVLHRLDKEAEARSVVRAMNRAG